MTHTRKAKQQEPGSRAKGPVREIVVAVAIALLVGGTSPWWWTIIFPSSKPPPAPPECSAEALMTELRLAGSGKAAVIESSATNMREMFRRQQFDCVYSLAAVLLQDDQDSGHGLFYSGEVWRVRAASDPSHADADRERMREHFFRYISIESDLPEMERDGKAEVCYQRSKGYCAERTAWINHLMAIDYYRQAQTAEDKDIKIQRLQRADKFLEKDLQYGGFDQIIPSRVLKNKVVEGLQYSNVQ